MNVQQLNRGLKGARAGQQGVPAAVHAPAALPVRSSGVPAGKHRKRCLHVYSGPRCIPLHPVPVPSVVAGTFSLLALQARMQSTYTLCCDRSIETGMRCHRRFARRNTRQRGQFWPQLSALNDRVLTCKCTHPGMLSAGPAYASTPLAAAPQRLSTSKVSQQRVAPIICNAAAAEGEEGSQSPQ
eukprot:1137345-Pelagomonas_calceolata.AAC.1